MTEESLLFKEHTAAELLYLAYGLVVVALLSSQLAHIGNGGYAHKHIVEPYSVLMRTQACKSAIAQSVLLMHDILGITVNAAAQLEPIVFQRGFNHSSADSSGIIKRMWVDDFTHQRVYLLSLAVHFSISWSLSSQKTHAFDGIVLIGSVAR